jgi:hypothetical protein
MWISAVGFLLSLILHIAWWLDVEMQLFIVTQILLLGMFLLFLPLNVIAKRLRRVYGKKGFREALKSVFPGWIASLTGFIIIYAIGIVLFKIVRKGDPAIVWSAILMAGYALSTSCYYSYNRLISSDNLNLSNGDDISRPPET